jgi:hypothetical protein
MTPSTQTAIDLSPYLVALFNFILAVVGAIIAAVINSKMKNQQMRDLLQSALTNSLGKIQVAADADITKAHIQIPNVNPALAVGVKYVLDHAGDAVTHFGITPESIAEAIEARIGVQNIETNKAIAASPSLEAPAPLAPVFSTSKGKVAAGLAQQLKGDV